MLMKKTLSTLMLALLCSLTSFAQFAPAEGRMYALKENTSGLYLDIQTLGINEPNANATTDNISLNAKPCVIYFAPGTADKAKWTMRNVNGKYAMQATLRGWNAVIGENAYEWLVSEVGEGLFTIARADGMFVNVDRKVAGEPLYCDKGTGMQFSLVDYSEIVAGDYTFRSPSGTYLSTVGGSASFQSTAEHFYAVPSANAFFFEKKDNAGAYIGSAHDSDVTADLSLWQFLAADDYGFSAVVRATDNAKHLGSDQNTDIGTAILTNVGSGCNRWSLEGVYDCATNGTVTDGKYHFESDYIAYAGACNKIRFTLTGSGAYYKNGAKRLSFDSFVLYNAEGKVVALDASDITGNNISAFGNMLDGANGTYAAGSWDAGSATDDWFEVIIDKDVELGGAFRFSFVTENTTMNAKSFEIRTSFEKPADYTFVLEAPDGTDITVTYDGKPIAAGDPIAVTGFSADLLRATEITGYVWSVVVDDRERTVTVVYTEAPDVENPAAVVALIKRVGGEAAADKFKTVLSPSLNSRQEAFLIGNEDGRILLKGTTVSAITTALGWYLNNYANINIAWNLLNEKGSGEAYADLSVLPLPTAEEVRVCDAKYRYFFNYCTFGYSMTTWTWKRWQQEIDWMALHGINMPLQIVGLEEVWRMFLTMEENGNRKYNYTDEEAKAFVAGPAFTAWWGMNNLEGWGGTDPGTLNGGSWNGAGGVQDDAWYVRQKDLARSIVDRQRELGMQPVLPGFSGMVPTNFTVKTGVATDANGGKWAGGFQRPRIIDPTYSGFAGIAADYYACLKEVMGESQYYSMDPFHEGGSISSGKYSEAYYALYEAMEAAKKGSQWIIQQWQWTGSQALSLTAVPAGRLVVLDLFSDGLPAFNSYNGYAPQDAVFCAIPNFGGRSGVMGRLNNLSDNYFSYKAKYSNIKGIGAAPEAIEQTPVTYDLLFQLPWMGEKPDVAEWVKQYATARYGVGNEVLQQAWELLRQGVLNYGADAIQGPVEDVWAARPNLNANPASSWGKTLNHAGSTYTKARRQMLIDAVYKMLSQSDVLNLEEGTVRSSNYSYDLVEFGGAVLADYAYDLLLGIKSAKDAAGNAFATDAKYIARRDAFLALIADVDGLKGTNLNFRLGKWTQEARDAAAEVVGAKTATADWYEFNNARTLITTWSSPNTNLNDYSYRSWQGLLKDFYLPRWKYYFDNNCTAGEYGYFEWNWAHGKEHYVGQKSVSTVSLVEGQPGYSYSREPEGSTVDAAKEILAKYIIPVRMSDGTYYAYRCLDNDLTAVCTIIANAGTTIDLTAYFGALEDVVLSGDFIDGNATDLSKVAIKSDAADGAHTGTITLADGTVLTFAVVLNPAYYGVYRIDYQSGGDIPLFMQYNEAKDNASNVGYKLIGEGTYRPDSEADKLFTIVPTGTGYSLSVQGKYMKSPNLSGWNHIMFSDNSAEAGVYLFEETGNDIFKIRSVGNGINYLNDYDNLIFGNDNSSKENLSTFRITKVDTYAFVVPENGMTTLCLPFNVVLPAGVEAYSLASQNVYKCGDGYVYLLDKVASAGEILSSSTPVVVKAAAGNYALPITMSGANTAASATAAALRSAMVKTTVGTAKNNYIFSDGAFCIVTEDTDIAANECWLELVENISTPVKGTLEVEMLPIKYETFYSPVAVELPSGITAHTLNIEEDKAVLSEGFSVVPANTGVVLYADVEENTTFSLATFQTDSSVESLLLGTAVDTYVQDKAYVLSAPAGVVGFYAAELDKDASGNEGSTHFLNRAMKAYLPADVLTDEQQKSTAFLLFPGSSTGIDGVKADSAKAEGIYDLQGRKVKEIKTRGIYLIDNKKVLVK